MEEVDSQSTGTIRVEEKVKRNLDTVHKRDKNRKRKGGFFYELEGMKKRG